MRIFNSGTSCGKSPVSYLLGETDHEGKARPIKPEVLAGNPNTTIAAIDSIQRKHKYTSGAIAFRDSENPTREQMLGVVDRFKATFCAGLSDDHFNSLFVLHKDKGNTEIHFIVPSIELKTGRRLNIHPPGRKNLEFFESFVSVANHDMGYAQVVPDPLKLAFSDFDRKSPAGKKGRRDKSLAHAEVVRAVRSGEVRNREDLCHYLEENLGIRVSRKGENYLSVILPNAKKAKRLTGPLYSANADYGELLKQSREARTPQMLTPSEYREQRARLEEFTEARAAFNVKAYLTPRPMRHRAKFATRTKITTTKEKTMSEKIPTMKAVRQNIEAIRNASIGIESGMAATKNPTAPSTPTISPAASNHQAESSSSDLDAASMNADGAVASANQAVSAAEIGVSNALADLKNARTPEQKARAEQAVFRAKQKAQMAHAKLMMAKIRAESLATKKNAARRKIR